MKFIIIIAICCTVLRVNSFALTKRNSQRSIASVVVLLSCVVLRIGSAAELSPEDICTCTAKNMKHHCAYGRDGNDLVCSEDTNKTCIDSCTSHGYVGGYCFKLESSSILDVRFKSQCLECKCNALKRDVENGFAGHKAKDVNIKCTCSGKITKPDSSNSNETILLELQKLTKTVNNIQDHLNKLQPCTCSKSSN